MLPFPWFVEKLLPIRFFLTQQRSQISKTKNKSLVSKTVIVNTSLLSPFPSLVNQVLLQLLGWDILVQYITNCYLDKYIRQFGQISFTIWTDTLSNLDKYILHCIHFHHWSIMFLTTLGMRYIGPIYDNWLFGTNCNLDKYVLQFWQVHF